VATKTLHLASNSTSRAGLLRQFGVSFVQEAPVYDEEQIRTDDAKAFVTIASQGKMESAVRAFGLSRPLLCADSVIALADGKILRKPKTLAEARAILQMQSGSRLSILSALVYQTSHRYLSNLSATHYHFAPFEEADLEAYLESGLWEGKVGGCMVEGFCKRYIRSVEGYESTAMGLQMEVVLPWLER